MSSPKTEQSPASRPAWRSPWVIGWVSMILIVLSINIFMAYLAMDTSPGLVVDDYYDRGQDYEKTILTRQALSRNFNFHVGVSSEIKLGKPAKFHFTASDRTGKAMQIDTVTLYAYRPSDREYDFSVPMTKSPVTKEKTSEYFAEAAFPLKGVWDIVVSATQGEVEHNVPRRIRVIAD